MAVRKKAQGHHQQAAAMAGMPFGVTLVVVWALAMVSLSGHVVTAQEDTATTANNDSDTTTAAPETCQDNTCSAQGQCNDTGGTIMCQCNQGWTGDRCDADINECDDASICTATSRCVNTNGSYACPCNEGYEKLPGATSCTDVNECAEEVCVNDYYCENKKGTFTCHCQEGWKGTNCTEDINECDDASICTANSRCVNTNGSYACPCNEGYETLPGATSCTEQVLLPYKTSDSSRLHGDDEIYGPFFIPGNFRLDGQGDVMAYYISINGYITFNSNFSSPTMPPDGSSRTSTLLFLAPYWADIDIPDSQDQSVTSGLYHVTLNLTDTFNNNETKALFDEYKDGLGFDPVFIAVVTWENVLPYKAEDYANFPGATFQVALFTDGVQTATRMAWRTVWPEREDLKVDAGMRFAGTSVKSISYAGAPLKRSDIITPDPDPKSTTAQCVEWRATQWGQFPTSGVARVACPCTLQQAQTDPVFSVVDATSIATGKTYDFNGLKQVCAYSSSTGQLDTNPRTAPIPLLRSIGTQPIINDTTAEDGRTKCCSLDTATSGTCAAFRELFPVETCARRQTPGIAALWGSLHAAGKLEDGTYYSYTFNGFGEYSVLKKEESSFEVQMRTEKVENLNVTVIKAVAVAFAGNSSEIHVANDGSLKMYVNGLEIPPLTLIPPSLGISIQYQNSNKEMEVVFPNGVVVTLKADTDRLALTVMWPAGYLEGYTGLLTQSAFSTASTTGTDSFQELYALKDETMSLFHYNLTGQGNNFTWYQDPDFVPAPSPSLDEQRAAFADNALCNSTGFDEGGQQCIEDILLTNNTQLAQESKDTVQKMLNYAQILGAKPPTFEAPRTWLITTATSTSVTQEFNVTGPNVTVTASGASDLNHTLEKQEGNTWRFVLIVEEAKLRALTTWELSFEAKSSLTNMTSVYSPPVVVCACADADQCDNALSRSAAISEIEWAQTGKLYLTSCQCGPGKSGRYCQDDVDACLLCYENATCDANATDIASVCTSCPPGYIGNGIKCFEIDECLREDTCDQMCSNTMGSYTCSCAEGYELRGSRSCVDVDECQGSTPCASDEFCQNTVPGNICLCRPGYIRANGTCTKVKATYGGSITFLSLKDQEWSPDLKNPSSEKFKLLATKVEKAISGQLTNKAISFLRVDVIAFELESGNRKRRSVDSSGNPKIKATYQVGSAQTLNTTVLAEAVKSGFDSSCSGDLCSYGDLKGVSMGQSGIDVNFDLCTSDRTNECHSTSTECVTKDGVAICQCRHGYKTWNLFSNVCQDVDECQDSTNTTQELCGLTEAEGASCNNTVGSYYCTCPQTHHWDSAAMQCSLGRNLCETDNPCLNGATCVSTEDQTGVACRCTDGWAGIHCGDEDAEAKKMKTALIVVGSVLGGLCLILLIALVIVCFVKRRRKGEDLDSGYEVSHGASIPRPHVGPSHSHSGGATADQRREMQRQNSMHKYTDFRRNDQDVGAKNGASGRGTQLYTNPAFTRDEERL